MSVAWRLTLDLNWLIFSFLLVVPSRRWKSFETESFHSFSCSFLCLLNNGSESALEIYLLWTEFKTFDLFSSSVAKKDLFWIFSNADDSTVFFLELKRLRRRKVVELSWHHQVQTPTYLHQMDHLQQELLAQAWNGVM